MKRVIVLIFGFLVAGAVAIFGIISYKIVFTDGLDQKSVNISDSQKNKNNKIQNLFSKKKDLNFINKKQYSYFAVLPNIDSETNYTDKYMRYLSKKYPNIKNIVIINKAPDTQKEFIRSFSKSGKYCIGNPINYNKNDCINAKSFDFYNDINLFSYFNPTKTYFSKDLKNYTIFPLINKNFGKKVNVYYLSIKKENDTFFGTKPIIKKLEKYKYSKGNILYLSLSNFSNYPQDKIAVFHDLKAINTLNSKNFSKIETECPNCLYLLKNIANYNGKKYFNIYRREVIKRKKIGEEKFFSSLTSKIYGEFGDAKIKNIGTDFLGNYKKSKFENGFSLGSKYSSKKIYGIFFGDTHFTRGFTYKNNLASKQEYFKCFYQDTDVKKPLFSNIVRMFYSFDRVGVNLETSVGEKNECGINNKSSILRTEPKYLRDFRDVGINLFNLANEHSYDCNKKGFEATKKWLNKYNLNGYGNPLYGEKNILKEEINGLKVAFMGINTVNSIVNLDKYEKTIMNLKKQKYVVIVNIHWGVELSLRSNKTQRQIARRLVDAGAKLIIGHHPHSVQESEVYRGVPIFYSLGNFIYDQYFKNTLKGQGLIYELSKNEIKYTLIDFERDPVTWEIKCDSFK